jgi:hypothetical protein
VSEIELELHRGGADHVRDDLVAAPNHRVVDRLLIVLEDAFSDISLLSRRAVEVSHVALDLSEHVGLLEQSEAGAALAKLAGQLVDGGEAENLGDAVGIDLGHDE